MENKNTNTNNINIHIPENKPTEKPAEPNWYIRTFIGAVIAIIVALAIYYGKQGNDAPGLNDAGSKSPTHIQPENNPLQPN